MDPQGVEPIVFVSSDHINDSCWRIPVQLEERVVHIWGFSLEGASSTIALCRLWMSVEEQARAGRFVRPEDGTGYILARGCLRAVLARYTGLDPSALTFQPGATGKPELAAMPDGGNRIRFNLSHSYGRMLIAVARRQEVGVDLERIREQVEAARLARRFYSPTECASVTGLSGPAQAARFFRYWAAKEAFLKCKGVGLQFPLDRCEITLSADGPTAAVSWKVASGSIEQGWVRFLPLEDGWIGAVTAGADEWRMDIRRWPLG